MPTSLAHKLSDLIYEIKEIKKQLILGEIKKAHITKREMDKWNVLSRKISSQWNGVSAVDEISLQREKTW